MAEELIRAMQSDSVAELEHALGQQKGGAAERFGMMASTALHAAVWHNSIAVIERLLQENASPDVLDGESGWSSLHRALYWGRMSCAALLLAAGAQLHVTDHQGRSPLDLVSAELKAYLTAATIGEVYSWGNGANYQLGSGATGLQLAPTRLEALHQLCVRAVVAAKFHSAAITEEGQIYTWGFGRGGRLGHADFHIHSGESAVILPQKVAFFSRRRVVSVAAAKHHTAAITSAGELFTWGSNRDGRLGYQAGDTQPTPRKITTFNRQKVAAVALANRHTVALLEGGSVYSWGSNLQGQLGYGTSDSASNAVPRIVEAMKGKHIKAIAAAKRHTVALTGEGDVYTWGHRVVTPKRVVLSGSRDVARFSTPPTSSGGWEVVFHKGQSEVARPEAVVIAAGAAHSSAVTRDGVVLAWRSMDPALRPQEVGGPLAGKTVTAISAGKYRTAAVTSEGDVYMWEGWSKAAEAVPKRTHNPLVPGTSPTEAPPPEWGVPKGLKQRKPGKSGALAFQLITPQRVEGVKRVTSVAVGEKHSLALQSWCSAPAFYVPPTSSVAAAASPELLLSPRGSEASTMDDAESLTPLQGRSTTDGLASDSYWEELEIAATTSSSAPTTPERPRLRPGSAKQVGCASLQRYCERCVAANMVEPRTALQILEYADAAGAQALRQHCIGVALSNLDLVLLESRTLIEQLLPHILADMEQQWSRRFPRAILAPHDSGAETRTASPKLVDRSPAGMPLTSSERSFRNPKEDAEVADRARQERTIRKKLQQIDALQSRADGGPLDNQQLAKVALRPALNAALRALQDDMPLEEVRRLLSAAQSPAVSSPKTVPNEMGAGHSERRQRNRRSRSVLSSSAGSSPVLGSSLQSPQDQRMLSLQATSPSNSQSSSVTRFRVTPAQLAVDSALPDSVPRVAGFHRQSVGAFPVWRGPSPQQGFAEPASASKLRSQGSTSSLATLHEATAMSTLPGLGDSHPSIGQSRVSGDGSVADAGAKVLTSSGKKPAKRKGGLSMFLSGQLQSPEPKPTTPPPAPKASPLTWSLQPQKSPTPLSLQEIQDQEAAESSAASRSSPSPSGRGVQGHRPSVEGATRPGKAAMAKQAGTQWGNVPSQPGNGRASDDNEGPSGMTISLGDLMKKKSKPIVMAIAAEPERRGPAWGTVSGGSPPSGQTRLSDIQAEQEHARENVSRSWGPSGASPGSHQGSHLLGNMTSWKTQSSLAAAPAKSSPGASFPAGTSPSGSRRGYNVSSQPQNKWYIKEEHEIVPLRSIQTEESAIKELSALYGAANVRVAPKASRPPRGLQ